MNNCFHFRKHQRNSPPDVTRNRPSRNSFFSVTRSVETKPHLPPAQTPAPLHQRTTSAIASATRVGGDSGSLHSRDRQAATRAIARCDAVVETIGFEPTTPCLQSRCSPS